MKSEVSRRYVKDSPTLWFPEEYHKAPKHSKQGASDEVFVDNEDDTLYYAENRALHSIEDYDRLLYLGLAPEEARGFLPQAMKTEWIWTGSLDAFRRVCRERLAPNAQGASRELAGMIQKAIAGKHGENWLE